MNQYSSSLKPMNPPHQSIAALPQPIEAVDDTDPLRFLNRTFDMVDDPSTDLIFSSSRMGNSFLVWDSQEFATTMFPWFFNRNNFSSFKRQLNTYISQQLGFADAQFVETVGTGLQDGDPNGWEFESEGFLRVQKHLLKTLKRRRAPPHLPSQQCSGQLLEIGQFGFDREIDQLRCDKSILLAEIVKLRQEQQNTQAHFKAMVARVQGMEQKQQQIMAFLARALHNPNLKHQLALRNDTNKELGQAILEKRRRPIYQGSTSCDGGTSNGQECSGPVKNKYGYEVTKLKSLALEIHGFGRSLDSGEVHEADLTNEFCVQLPSEGMSERGASSSKGNKDDDVDVLAEQLG